MDQTSPRPDAPQVLALRVPPADPFPNNPSLPVMIYRAALPVSGTDLAAAFERRFDSNLWPSAWRNGIFATHHYHSTAHEALGVYRGRAVVQLGGPSGPQVEISAGDVVIIPAGVAHKRISSGGRLGVVGAYPSGQTPDHCEDDLGRDNVPGVTRPTRDPFFGEHGGIIDEWID